MSYLVPAGRDTKSCFRFQICIVKLSHFHFCSQFLLSISYKSITHIPGCSRTFNMVRCCQLQYYTSVLLTYVQPMPGTVYQRLAMWYHVCDSTCKISLAICRKSMALCVPLVGFCLSQYSLHVLQMNS